MDTEMAQSPADPKAAREGIRKADRAAARVASRQWGVLSHAQAIKAGLTSDQITYRLKTGQWRRVAWGVYAVAGAPDRWEKNVMVACLAGPAGTAASHLSAAALFSLAKPPLVPQVTVKRGSSGRFTGAHQFRSNLGPGDTCIRHRIRCTTPARTIVDCAAAGLLDTEALWDLVDSALCKKLLQPSRLIRASGRAWGTARGRRRSRLAGLERAIDVWRSGAPAGSPPEARLQRRLMDWDFPRAERQVEVYDEDGTFVARADVGIRELKVLFEYDSDEHHGPRCWIADDELERIRRSRSTVTVTVERDIDSGGSRFAA